MKGSGMTWDDYTNATLSAMKEAGKTNRAIGEHFGTSEAAIAAQWARLRSAKLGDRKGERWSDEENADLIASGDKGEDWGEIGLRLKRSRWSCKVQYNSLKRGAASAQPSYSRIARQSATALAKEIRDTIPQHRSITAELFGDPLPGRSALDRRAGQ